nr:hypothetical protein B0A51_05560 [Rachicladosporium sp. CCFEE 5018]
MSSALKPSALHGFAKSSAYDQHRPSYPAKSVQELLRQCRVAGVKGAEVLDLAAGTGKFTELLAAREEGYEVVAVEPHQGMREVLEAKGLKGVKVEDGDAESLPFEDESVDAIIAAQAFHWFATHSILKSLHRVLRPHGALGLIWNIEHYNEARSHVAATSWEAKLHNLIWSFEDNEPRFRHEKWRTVFDEQIKTTPLSLLVAADPLFALPLGEEREEWVVWLQKERVWERFATLSQIAGLDGEKLEKTRKVFDDAINAPDVEVNEKGEVAVHGTTYVVWTTKVPADGRPDLTGVERPGA